MMPLLNWSVVIAQTTTVPDDRAKMLQTFGLMIFMALMMYLLMFRPQQKKAREHAALLKTIKSGDKIVTSGGIVGVVTGIKEKTVSIRSGDAKMEVLKSAIGEITERAGEGQA